jgi:hypothetical protein
MWAVRTRLVFVAVALSLLAGCSQNEAPQTPTTPPSSHATPKSALPTTLQSSAPPTTEVPAPTTETAAGPITDQKPELVIVSCQMGLGPIETYWSDGTQTGWSQYCQNQHDTVLQNEREANQPREKQISWCGTDKNIYNRGETFYTDGTSTSWTQYCADQFEAINNPPRPPGTNGGGGAVAGPCEAAQQDVITYTPDGRKQQCSNGHWVYIA